MHSDGVTTMKWLYVNILEMLSCTHFIVADHTAVAIMEIEERAKDHVEVGQGLKLTKALKIDKDLFLLEGTAMKTKPMKLHVNKLSLEEMRRMGSNLETHKKYKNVKEINESDDTDVDRMLVSVSTISRTISTQFGDYKICNISDVTNTSLSMNLYPPHLDCFVKNNVYTIKNLKKITMKNGEKRLMTCRYTKITPANTEEEKLFNKNKPVKSEIEGYCIMFTDLICYKSCPIHNTKIENNNFCIGCKKKISVSEKNFRCLIYIDTKELDDLIPILIFKNHLNIDSQISETNVKEGIEKCVINRNVKIQFIKKGESNIATMVEIN